jgi:hypothetical protein
VVAFVEAQFVDCRSVERLQIVGFRQAFALRSLLKMFVGADDRVLQVRAGLSLEAQRLSMSKTISLPRENFSMK